MGTTAFFRSTLPVALSITLGSTAQAQGTCADINIVSVTYAAFNDSSIEILAHTNEGTFFSYPTFSLVNEGGDTLTREEVNFFGIGPNEQTHRSTLLPGQSMPLSPFTGTLVFTYYGDTDIDTCVYPISGSLCPPAPCSALQVFVYNSGSLVNAAFDWTITDDQGVQVGAGALAIDAADQQTDLDSLCLPAGAYTLHMTQSSGPAGAYQYGMTRQLFMIPGPGSVFFQAQPNNLPFVFYELCIEGTNAIPEPGSNSPVITLADRQVTVTSPDGSPLGMLELLDASGRVIHRSRDHDAQATIDLRSQPVGMYVLRTNSDGAFGSTPSTQRIILF